MIKNFISWKKWFEVEENGGLFVDLYNEYSSRDLHKLSKTDYLNFYKGRCYVAVSTIANAVAQLDKQITDWKGTPINDPLFDLITYDLLVNIVSYMKLNGACYIWKNSVWNKVVSLHVLRPDRVETKLNDSQTDIEGYIYSYGATKKKYFKKEEVIAILNFNPMFPYPLNYVWMSDVAWIATAIDADYQASKWNWKFFYNNANVDGVLETEQNLTPETIEQIQKKWDAKYRGVDNSHKIGILTWWMKYNKVNANQKEMDFVESRRLNRDEILWFFRVPKAMIWLWEGDNALNVRSFQAIFAREVVKPLATRIAEALNYELFGEWKWFEFVNIVPTDLEQTRQDWMANAMTLNEFRATRNLPPVADGDRLRSAYIMGVWGAWSDAWNEEQNVVDLDKGFKKKANPELKKELQNIIWKKFKELERGTEEYNQKYWERKMERNNHFNELYFAQLQKIFAKQEKEIMKEYKTWFSNQKDIKAKDFPLLNLAKWAMIYQEFMKEPQDTLVKVEGQDAFVEVWIFDEFKITDAMSKLLKKNISKFAWSIDTDTNKKLTKNFETIIEQGLSFEKWRKLLQDTFTELKTTRADLIVRTETIRAGNMASQWAWEESGVVEKKQRYTALDERVCEFCWPMNWKTIALKDNYFNKGTTLIGADWHELKLDYDDVEGAPLHPNCRCVLLPVVE